MTDEIHIFLLTFTVTLLIPFLFSVSPGFEVGARAGVGVGRGMRLGLRLRRGSSHLLICGAFVEDENASCGCQQGL